MISASALCMICHDLWHLSIELDKRRLRFETERYLPFDYKGDRVHSHLKVALPVENQIIVGSRAF